MRTIKCQICGKEVEAKSGRQKYCPECARELKKEYRRAGAKRWHDNNRERHIAYCREYHQKNKASHNEKKREYYHRTKVLADREGNNFCVYIHTDQLGKVYIGRAFGDNVKTVNRQRWRDGRGYKKCPRFWEAIQEFGWNNIQHELLEWNLTYEEALEREQYWIERYNSRNPEYGYNMV